jgi:hypothetical protein
MSGFESGRSTDDGQCESVEREAVGQGLEANGAAANEDATETVCRSVDSRAAMELSEASVCNVSD